MQVSNNEARSSNDTLLDASAVIGVLELAATRRTPGVSLRVLSLSFHGNAREQGPIVVELKRSGQVDLRSGGKLDSFTSCLSDDREALGSGLELFRGQADYINIDISRKKLINPDLAIIESDTFKGRGDLPRFGGHGVR